MRVFREICHFVCVCVPFGFQGRMWDLIVLVPNHCLSLTFLSIVNIGKAI